MLRLFALSAALLPTLSMASYLDVTVVREEKTSKIDYRLTPFAKQLLKSKKGSLQVMVEAEPELKKIVRFARAEKRAQQSKILLFANGVLIDSPAPSGDPCCDGFWNGFWQGLDDTLRGKTLKEDLGAFASGAVFGPILNSLLSNLPHGKLLALGGVIAFSKDFLESKVTGYQTNQKGWSDSFIWGRVVFDFVKELALVTIGMKSSEGLGKLLAKIAKKNPWAKYLIDFFMEAFTPSPETKAKNESYIEKQKKTFDKPNNNDAPVVKGNSNPGTTGIPHNTAPRTTAPKLNPSSGGGVAVLEKPILSKSPAPKPAPTPVNRMPGEPLVLNLLPDSKPRRSDPSASQNWNIPSLVTQAISPVSFSVGQSELLRLYETWSHAIDWDPSALALRSQLTEHFQKRLDAPNASDLRALAKILSSQRAGLPEEIRDYILLHLDLGDPGDVPVPTPSESSYEVLRQALDQGLRNFAHLNALRTYRELCRTGVYKNEADCRKIEEIFSAIYNIVTYLTNKSLQDVDPTFTLEDEPNMLFEYALNFFLKLATQPETSSNFLRVYSRLKRLKGFDKSDVSLVVGFYLIHLNEQFFDKTYKHSEKFERAWKRANFKFRQISILLLRKRSKKTALSTIFNPLIWAMDDLLGATSIVPLYQRAVSEAEKGILSDAHFDALVALAVMDSDNIANPAADLVERARSILEMYHVQYSQRNDLPIIHENPVEGATTHEEALHKLETLADYDVLIEKIPQLEYRPHFDISEILQSRLANATRYGFNIIRAERGHPYACFKSSLEQGWGHYLVYAISTILNHRLPESDRLFFPPVAPISYGESTWFLVDYSNLKGSPMAPSALPLNHRAYLALFDAILGLDVSSNEINVYGSGSRYTVVMPSSFDPKPIMRWALDRLPRTYAFGPVQLRANAKNIIDVLETGFFDDALTTFMDINSFQPLMKPEDLTLRIQGILDYLQQPDSPASPTQVKLPSAYEMLLSGDRVDPLLRERFTDRVKTILSVPFAFGNAAINPYDILEWDVDRALAHLEALMNKEDPRNYLYDAPFDSLRNVVSDKDYHELIHVVFTNQLLTIQQMNELPISFLLLRTTGSEVLANNQIWNPGLMLSQSVRENLRIYTYLWSENYSIRETIDFYDDLKQKYLAHGELQKELKPAIHLLWYYFWRHYEQYSYADTLLELDRTGRLERLKQNLFSDLRRHRFGKYTEDQLKQLSKNIDYAIALLHTYASREKRTLEKFAKENKN